MEGKRSNLTILMEQIAPTSNLKVATISNSKENNFNKSTSGKKSKINQIIDNYNESYNANKVIDSGWDKIEKKVQKEYLDNLKEKDPKQYYRLIAGYGKKTTSKKRKRKQRKKKT